jgi:predicted dehydrogenase
MKIGIIGMGGIGRQRLAALRQIHDERLAKIDVTVCDMNVQASICAVRNFEHRNFVVSVCEPHEMPTYDMDAFIVCLPHYQVLPTLTSLFRTRTPAKVLVEKPLGCNLAETTEIIELCPQETELYVGHNYRFMLAIRDAFEAHKDGELGKIVSVHMTLAFGYGPSGIGTWKVKPEQSGGGCVLDPGVHLIDLALRLDSGLKLRSSEFISNLVLRNGAEEEAAVHMCSPSSVPFYLDISTIRWVNTFRMELNGTEGYAIVEGRGGNYGPQTLRIGEKWGWHATPSTQRETERFYNYGDHVIEDSFYRETASFLDLGEITEKPCTGEEALRRMEIIEQCTRYLKGEKSDHAE